MDKFELIKIIGEGTYGKVYLAKHKTESNQCVIKEIDFTKVKKFKFLLIFVLFF